MDRRTVFTTLFGLAGVGVTLRWSKHGIAFVKSGGGTGAALAAPVIRQSRSGDIKAVSLAQVPIGGGGFVTGIDISSDGRRMLCRTDVANAYVRNGNEQSWRPLFSPATMDISDYDPLPHLAKKADGQGVAGIRIAPSNPDIIFASYYGYIWRSIDGGLSIRRTLLPQKTMLSNSGSQRLFNRTIDIHPLDPRKVVVGTWGDGIWYTMDGGNEWSEVTIPKATISNDGQPGVFLVSFDPTAVDRVYSFVTGVGLFRSDTGPAGEFYAVRGGPTHCSSMVVGSDKTVYLCEQSPKERGKIWRYSSEKGWGSSQPEYEMFAVAVDPFKPNRLVVVNANGYFAESSDGGQSFRSIGGGVWSSNGGEVQWTGELKSLFPAELRFDPAEPGRLWVAQGVGVAKAKITETKYYLEDWSAGIEELCAVGTLCVPGGKTFLSAWDKSFWRVDNLTAYTNTFRYPLRRGKTHDADLVAYGSYMDFAREDSQYIVGIIAPSDISAPGFTTNGGDSWQAFNGVPDTGWGRGGCIACSTKNNIVLLPSNNAVGVFTVDGGMSWHPVRLDGSNPTGGFANSYVVQRKNISADKTRSGTFALIYTVIQGETYANPLGGVWLTRDGGISWTQKLTGVIGTISHDPKTVRAAAREERQFWQCQLEYVPGCASELLYTPHADYAADQFFWSRDDGESWTEPNAMVRNVSSFGFGKASLGQTRPAVYFWGEVDGIEGLFASFDWFVTKPRLLTKFPSQMLAKPSSITGDLNRFGRAYIGTSCAGWVMVDVEL